MRMVIRKESIPEAGVRRQELPDSPWLFGSFFLGGFECSTHRTPDGHRLDLIAATQHDIRAREDYGLCRDLGIRAVREAVRWPLVDRGGVLDLGDVRRLARIGAELEMLQIWDLMHYGYPDDLSPWEPQTFVDRFAAYAKRVARAIREENDAPGWYTPINEISYYAWAGGHVGYMAPFGRERGGEMKRILVRAALAAADGIWDVDPEARMLTVDPLVHLHAPPGRPDLQPQADHFNHHVVTEAFDLLAGRLEPELGGSRRHLGILGFNYYACNQWTIPTPQRPQHFLRLDDPDWVPLSKLLSELQERYGGPLLLAETGASGDERPAWLAHLTEETGKAHTAGVDLQGACLYPIITSPDWEDPTAFFDGGVWDVVPESDGGLRRVLAQPVARALREAQAILDPSHLPENRLEAAPPLPSAPPIRILDPLDEARFKTDNFSHRTLLVGDSLAVELYGFEPGGSLPAHRHDRTEHVWTVISGIGKVRIGNGWETIREGETTLVPAGCYHGIQNTGTGRMVVQQVSSPKPWDARFRGPHPTEGGAVR